LQGGIVPESSPVDEIPIAIESRAQDHEDEEETRRRLEEWRCMAANLSGGFTQMPDAIRKDVTLSSNAKQVYEHLLSFMWNKEWCWPSQQLIAEQLGISRRTVIRVCKELHERCYIEKWRRGLGRTNVYFINPLSFITFRVEPLTSVTLHLPEGATLPPGAPLTGLYGTTFYANDAAPPSLLKECQKVISRSATMALPEEPKSHTKHTKEKQTEEKERYSNYSTPRLEGTGSTPQAIGNDQEGMKPNGKGTKEYQTPNVTPPSKTNKNPKDAGKGGREAAKDVANAKAAKQPSERAQAIAEATGIPAEHLAEMNIAQGPKQRPIPDFIRERMARYTNDLGDSPRSAKSNITRAAKLYYFGVDFIKDAQEDPEGWFIDLLYETKQSALSVPGVRKRTGSRVNRVPVFFSLLEKKFGFSDDELAFLRSDLPLLEPEDR
jgi:hypothetical protein